MSADRAERPHSLVSAVIDRRYRLASGTERENPATSVA
jgi:hypothetical protein